MIDLEKSHPYRLLTTAEVSELLRISKSAVRKLARDKALRAITNFRHFHFTVEAVREFIGSSSGAPRAPEM